MYSVIAFLLGVFGITGLSMLIYLDDKASKKLRSEYYVAPHGCTDGDYWLEGGDPDCFVKCPKCNNEVKLFNTSFAGQIVKRAYNIAMKYRYSFGRHGKRYTECGTMLIRREDKWDDEKD